MNFLSKIKFLWKKPKVIIVTGEGRACAQEAIFQVLKAHFKVGEQVLIFETDFKDPKAIGQFQFLIKISSRPVLVITQIGDVPFDRDFFAGEKVETIEIRKLAKILPPFGYLILNFDDETVREIKTETNLKEITFGFQTGADFRATDIKLNRGTNFKLNYKGNVVPVWLEKLFGKEQIYAGLTGAVVGTIFGLNLVEISQALKNYFSLAGKMRLLEGIKRSWILDNSASATSFSMIEAIEILGKTQGFKRKIAVLGDVIGIGKYTIEAHETIGERASKNADLLFTFGQRANFIGKTAFERGMATEKIFQFETIEKGKLKLQDEIKEGDLVLVNGSREMEMRKIVEEIKL